MKGISRRVYVIAALALPAVAFVAAVNPLKIIWS
jgi:hypothetical protein